ncbi:hypothetical protein CRUP_002907 [Coryphaenoides rupestris]|nr:hypothetical protein CRUP_002907 [Coryphaenoides rupestris]
MSTAQLMELFGSLAPSAANPTLEDGEDFDRVVNGTCEPVDSPVGGGETAGQGDPPPHQTRDESQPASEMQVPADPHGKSQLEISRVRSPTNLPRVPERILAKCAKEGPPLGTNYHVGTKFPRPLNQSVCVEQQFTNPGALPDFEQKKSVYLRYSLNNWITFMDSLASYVPDSSDGVTDRFSFKITTPTFREVGGGGGGGTLQFAIRYCVGGEEYWDNNVGKNYKVRRHNKLKMSPPREWENSWIHFI